MQSRCSHNISIHTGSWCSWSPEMHSVRQGRTMLLKYCKLLTSCLIR
uniref:Uncharacterized protein n=1 Tax=Arundo donax TaxID=35708 RepID=A0A0A9EQ28_ARUDO